MPDHSFYWLKPSALTVVVILLGVLALIGVLALLLL